MSARCVLLVGVLALACDPAGDSLAADEGGSDTGAASTTGNYPDPAVDLCGALPNGVVAMDQLASAHAVTGPRPAGSTTSADAVRIRLSSWGVDAMQPFPNYDPGEPGCIPGWALAFDLPLDVAVGSYAIGELLGDWELDEIEADAGGDCRDGGGEVGGDGMLEVSGNLELFTVSETCVVGEISGTDPTNAGLVDGGFVAPRSMLACVPTAAGCG